MPKQTTAGKMVFQKSCSGATWFLKTSHRALEMLRSQDRGLRMPEPMNWCLALYLDPTLLTSPTCEARIW